MDKKIIGDLHIFMILDYVDYLDKSENEYTQDALWQYLLFLFHDSPHGISASAVAWKF